MKGIKVIAVFGLLVLFPLISYLYLRQGYYFRLNALKELEPKMKLENFSYSDIVSDDVFSDDRLKGRLSLFYDASTVSSKGMLDPIFEEFSHREELQFVGFTDDTMVVKSHLNKDDDQWILLEGKYKWDGKLALVDTSGTIRNFYTFDSASFSSLGQHIPIVMPRVKEQDIKMKSEK